MWWISKISLPPCATVLVLYVGFLPVLIKLEMEVYVILVFITQGECKGKVYGGVAGSAWELGEIPGREGLAHRRQGNIIIYIETVENVPRNCFYNTFVFEKFCIDFDALIACNLDKLP